LCQPFKDERKLIATLFVVEGVWPFSTEVHTFLSASRCVAGNSKRIHRRRKGWPDKLKLALSLQSALSDRNKMDLLEGGLVCGWLQR
jgi:hypothetical protein